MSAKITLAQDIRNNFDIFRGAFYAVKDFCIDTKTEAKSSWDAETAKIDKAEADKAAVENDAVENGVAELPVGRYNYTLGGRMFRASVYGFIIMLAIDFLNLGFVQVDIGGYLMSLLLIGSVSSGFVCLFNEQDTTSTSILSAVVCYWIAYVALSCVIFFITYFIF